LDASKEGGLEIKAEETKHMSMSRHQTTGQNHYIKVANKSFEYVAKFKYLGTALTNRDCIYEEINNSLNSFSPE
jgi:hypothetical protein